MEKEQVQLQQATQELAVAIEDLKEQQLDNILMQVGLVVVSAVATWGLGNVLTGAMLQIARATVGITMTVGLSNLDPESRKAQQRAAANSRRGPPPLARGKMSMP